MNSKLPETDSIQALAEFWDAHDVTDFQDELEEVSESVFERDTPITIHLRPDEVTVVHRVAQSQGLDDVELVRLWIAEKIKAS